MAGFMPAIHDLGEHIKDVDGRDKPGHDEGWCSDEAIDALCSGD
jgi:hypothetical protein